MDWTTLLQPGERLVWEGRPAPRCYTMRNWRHALFGVILLVPTLYWQAVALQLGAVYRLPLVPWIPLPFLLAALYLALGQLFVARLEWENVFYAVTDRRILARRGLLRIRHLALDLEAVGSFVLKPYGEELASLRIVAADFSTTLVLSCIEYPRLVTCHLEATMAAAGRLAGKEPPSSAGETG
jgi:hypothetical protein